MMKML